MSQVAISGNASGTGTLTIAAPNTNSNRTLTLPDGTGTFTVNGVNSNIVSGTAVASTSGTSIDFTSIPSWVKRITVMFSGISTTGLNPYIVQIGSGSVSSSGYLSSTIAVQAGTTNSAGSTSTAGFLFVNAIGASTYVYSGSIVIQNISGNTWVESGVLTDTLAVRASISGGNCTLGGVLDRIRVTTTTGVDTFDAGSINILYE